MLWIKIGLQVSGSAPATVQLPVDPSVPHYRLHRGVAVQDLGQDKQRSGHTDDIFFTHSFSEVTLPSPLHIPQVKKNVLLIIDPQIDFHPEVGQGVCLKVVVRNDNEVYFSALGWRARDTIISPARSAGCTRGK